MSFNAAAFAAARKALGPRVRPKNNKVAVFGDSIASHASLINGAAPNINRRTMAHGYVPWAAFLSRQRFWFDPDWNGGVPGNTTTEALARLAAFLKTNDCGTVILDVGTNDGANSVTVAQTKINIALMINMIRNDGRLVVLWTPRPRDKTAVGLTMTDVLVRNHIQRRDHYLSLHNPGNGIYVLDSWDFLGDRSSSNFAMIAGVHYDGLHPNQMGAYLDGLLLAKLFGIDRDPGLFPFVDVLPLSVMDNYSAADNPRGALNANPMMTGGSTNATSYSAINGQGMTTTLSKVASGNKVWQQGVIAGTITGTGLIWPVAQNPISAANLAVGDVIEGFCDFELDAGQTGIAGIGLALMDNTSFARAMCLDSTTEINTSLFPNVAVKGVMRLPRFTLTSTGVRGGIACSGVNGATANLTFRVGAMAFRKVLP